MQFAPIGGKLLGLGFLSGFEVTRAKNNSTGSECEPTGQTANRWVPSSISLAFALGLHATLPLWPFLPELSPISSESILNYASLLRRCVDNCPSGPFPAHLGMDIAI